MTITPRSSRFANFMRSTKPSSSATVAEDAPASEPVAFSPDDHAAPILAGEPRITDQQRSDMWEVFHSSKDPGELAQHLQLAAVPADTKARLLQAKQASMPVPSAIDRTDAAVHHLAQMDPQIRAIAERHPTLLKHFIAAQESKS